MIVVHPDGTIDSGELHGFNPFRPYAEEKLLLRTLPLEVLQAPAGDEIQEYYGIPEARNYGNAVGPTWSQVAALIDYLDEHPGV
jgi:hypothetical protein